MSEVKSLSARQLIEKGGGTSILSEREDRIDAYISNLEKERDELKAQLDELRVAVKACFKEYDETNSKIFTTDRYAEYRTAEILKQQVEKLLEKK